MSDALDIRVASALMRLRLIERALHGRGEWSMEYAGVTAPVCRFVRNDRVSLVAHFPPLCLLDDPPLAVSLFEDGDLVHVLPLAEPLCESGASVWLDVAIPDPVTV